MSVCASGVTSAYHPPGKPRAALLLDVPNIVITAINRGLFVNFRRMLLGLAHRFDIAYKVAFLHPKRVRLHMFLESIGFEVKPLQYNADALIGFMAASFIDDGVEAIIICSMDGDFVGVEEGAVMKNVEVYYVGFEGSYSSLLRRKNLITLESLGCVEIMEPQSPLTSASSFSNLATSSDRAI